MRKIKWENIFIIIILPLFTYGIVLHYLNGTTINNIILEILIYYGLAFIIRSTIKDIRRLK